MLLYFPASWSRGGRQKPDAMSSKSPAVLADRGRVLEVIVSKCLASSLPRPVLSLQAVSALGSSRDLGEGQLDE